MRRETRKAGSESLVADAVARLRAALEDRYRIERELGRGGMATVRGYPRFTALLEKMNLA